MANKKLCIALVLIITWANLIGTTLGAAGWCYQCNSKDPNCQLQMSPVGMGHYRIPCNGQCYIRILDGVLSRGCSWEYGFMTRQVVYVPIALLNAIWIFCDTPLCNSSPNKPDEK